MLRGLVLVYGAYGFTGQMVVENLRQRRIEVLVAGRDPVRVRDVAAKFNSNFRVFALHEADEMSRALRDVDVVVNVAGPFSSSVEPLLHACIHHGRHYLDVSGEVASLSYAASHDGEAKAHRVMVLPGVGFDVVPSDCLAVHLANRLPGATELTLSISGSNLFSRGSALTFAEHAGVPVYVRKRGLLEPMLFRTQMRWVDFGFAVRPVLAVSWGDLVTAFHSTKIPDIEVYFEATVPRLLGVAGNQYFGWMYGSPFAKGWFRAFAGLVPSGPTPEERRGERAVIVGEAVRNRDRVRARLVTPEAYSFTGATTAAVVERVLAGAVVPGFQTPGTLLGPDFVTSLDGVLREDVL